MSSQLTHERPVDDRAARR